MVKPLALGIIGYPVGHSLSPLMHTIAGAHNDILLSYGAFEVRPENLADAISGVRALGLDGVNITVPHKVAVMNLLDEVSEEARLVGAVNTIVNNNGRLIGHNTDAIGFVTSVKKNAKIDPAGLNVFIYGAGGAARAVATGLARAGAKSMTIANRTVDKAESLAEKVAGATKTEAKATGYDESDKLLESIGTADIIINTTSVGLDGTSGENELPAIEAIRKETLLAVDIVYQPINTPFLLKAKEVGAKTLDGLWMLIHQGDKAFNLWTGAQFPVTKVREALLDKLA